MEVQNRIRELTPELVLEELDHALTEHFFSGRGWIGYKLVLPSLHAEVLQQIGRNSEFRRRRRSLITLNKSGRYGFITLNLSGKVIGGGISRFKMGVRVVDSLPVPRVVPDSEIEAYFTQDDVNCATKSGEGGEVEQDLIEAARVKRIDVTNKTREELLKLIYG